MRKRFSARVFLAVLLTLSLVFMTPGCGKKTAGENASAVLYSSESKAEQPDAPPDLAPEQEEEQPETDSDTDIDIDNDSGQDAVPLIDEDGTYTSKSDVALYLHTYGRLPSNFITKKQAKKLGWSGGSLEDYAPGKCIGGDYFGNYEGLLPKDKEYHECDIDTLGKKKRGAKRIIYSDDGYIYYTEDHYESFELLYSP